MHQSLTHSHASVKSQVYHADNTPQNHKTNHKTTHKVIHKANDNSPKTIQDTGLKTCVPSDLARFFVPALGACGPGLGLALGFALGLRVSVRVKG